MSNGERKATRVALLMWAVLFLVCGVAYLVGGRELANTACYVVGSLYLAWGLVGVARAVRQHRADVAAFDRMRSR